jgi:hypothetical protein
MHRHVRLPHSETDREREAAFLYGWRFTCFLLMSERSDERNVVTYTPLTTYARNDISSREIEETEVP